MATAAERRRAQNRGVKAGAVRIGAKGKTVRRYNPKTGRWDVTKKNVKPGVSLAAKPSSRTAASKPVKPTVKGARSGPLSANTGVQYKAKTSTTSSGKNWWSPGGGGLVGPNSPLRGNGSSSSKPKKGDRRRKGSYGGYETYDGTRWVKSK
jgi:hypothetical protein